MYTILILAQDEEIFEQLNTLDKDMYHVVLANSIEQGLARLDDKAPSLIILDHVGSAMMCANYSQRIRSIPRFIAPPLLVLDGPQDAEQMAMILDSGADDCLRKPFIPRELAARVRALLRRPNQTPVTLMLTLYRQNKSVLISNRPVELTPTEFDLLEALCRIPGRHVPANTLLQEVWNYPPGIGDPALVRNHVRNLRRKLERDPERPRIVTSAHGRGYAIGVDIRMR